MTIVRLGQINREDAVWVQGMNRLRHAYLDIAPELEPYFVTSRYDDDEGMLRRRMARPKVTPQLQGFVAIPGVIAVLDAVVAAPIAGIAALGLDAGTASGDRHRPGRPRAHARGLRRLRRATVSRLSAGAGRPLPRRRPRRAEPPGLPPSDGASPGERDVAGHRARRLPTGA